MEEEPQTLWLNWALSKTIYALAFNVVFIVTLIYFRSINVYKNNFFSSGITFPYNIFRIVFIFYLFGIIVTPGYLVLKAVGPAESFQRLPPAARLTMSFFCGAALWHVLLLVLGFLDLYHYPVAVTLSVPAVALTGFCLRSSLVELHSNVHRFLRSQPRTIATAILILAGLTAAGGLLLLFVKGLYPAGGHDYFNHYHEYYDAVLRNHGLWPNDVWYHFYYSKGMGLFFLSMLLTDPLAPSLVTYCFAIGTAMALFLLISDMSPVPTFWPWIAVITYFVFYTFTPGAGVYLANGGWGDFEKPHEINAAFVIGFLWLCARLHGSGSGERRIWFTAAAACIFLSPAIELITVFLLVLFTATLTAVALIRRSRDDAIVFFALSAVGGCGLVAVLTLNYLVTGLPSDQFAPEFWPWVNVQTLNKWGALPFVIFEMQGLAAFKSQGLHWLSWPFVLFYRETLRLDILHPLLIRSWILVPLIIGTAFIRRYRPQPGLRAAPLWIVVVFLGVVTVAAAVAGANQTISFYRYSSFALPLVISLAACGWVYIFAPIGVGWLGTTGRYLLPVWVLSVALGYFWKDQKPFLKQIIPNAIAFADGSISIRQAYADQQGWPGRLPWGGIFPGTIGAWRTAGSGVRIWSMHLHAYCMLPHCRSETFNSFILSPHLLDMLRGSAEETRDILQREGLNYFFYTTAMDFNDILPLTKPFAPDRIADYVGVKWTDGTSYLLTWIGPGVTPSDRRTGLPNIGRPLPARPVSR